MPVLRIRNIRSLVPLIATGEQLNPSSSSTNPRRSRSAPNQSAHSGSAGRPNRTARRCNTEFGVKEFGVKKSSVSRVRCQKSSVSKTLLPRSLWMSSRDRHKVLVSRWIFHQPQTWRKEGSTARPHPLSTSGNRPSQPDCPTCCTTSPSHGQTRSHTDLGRASRTGYPLGGVHPNCEAPRRCRMSSGRHTGAIV